MAATASQPVYIISFKFKECEHTLSSQLTTESLYLAGTADRNDAPDALLFSQKRLNIIGKYSCFGRGHYGRLILRRKRSSNAYFPCVAYVYHCRSYRNRMKRSLAMRAFLKLNANIVGLVLFCKSDSIY
jgi:hypothetical protein